MDILTPDLVWIDNRCYRKLPILDAEKDIYREEDLYPSDPDDKDEEEDDSSNLPINFDGQKFWISIYVPGPLMGLVIGKSYRTIKAIESSTNAQINLPKLLTEDESINSRGQLPPRIKKQAGDVVITGENKHSVSSAYNRIDGIISHGRFRVGEYTHFISIPMNSDKIQNSFLEFQEDILKTCKSAQGVNKQIFEFPAKLHLTIAMLVIFDDRDKELAKATLQKCRTDILNTLGGKTLRVEVKGIEYMNDNPGEVDVLYGKVREVDDDNMLQLIAEKLSKDCIAVNLSQKEYDFVKLHVTLMKSRGNAANKRSTFDARPILKKYSDYSFGEMTISEIHISVRYTGGQDSYYTSTAIITL